MKFYHVMHQLKEYDIPDKLYQKLAKEVQHGLAVRLNLHPEDDNYADMFNSWMEEAVLELMIAKHPPKKVEQRFLSLSNWCFSDEHDAWVADEWGVH